MVEKRLPGISKAEKLSEKYDIPEMGVVVLRGYCPTNRGSCPIVVIVLRGKCPRGVVVLVGNLQRGSCPTGVKLMSYGVVVPRVVVPGVVVLEP